MKKDIAFIFIVIAFGIAGLIYTNKSSDDVLIQRSKNTSKSSNLSRKDEFDIYYESLRSGESAEYGKSAFDENILKEFEGALEAKQSKTPDAEKPNASEIIAVDDVDPPELEEEKKPLIDWQYLYDRWQIVLIDSISDSSTLENVNSEKDCSLVFLDRIANATQIEINKNLELKSARSTLTFTDENQIYKLNGLKSVVPLKNATQTLMSFCSQ